MTKKIRVNLKKYHIDDIDDIVFDYDEKNQSFFRHANYDCGEPDNYDYPVIVTNNNGKGWYDIEVYSA